MEGTEAVISHDVPSFSLMHVLLSGQFRDDPTSLTHSPIRRNLQYNCGRPWPAAYININQNTHQIQVLTKPLCRAQAIF